jgi:hypothetical protein
MHSSQNPPSSLFSLLAPSIVLMTIWVCLGITFLGTIYTVAALDYVVPESNGSLCYETIMNLTHNVLNVSSTEFSREFRGFSLLDLFSSPRMTTFLVYSRLLMTFLVIMSVCGMLWKCFTCRLITCYTLFHLYLVAVLYFSFASLILYLCFGASGEPEFDKILDGLYRN